MMKRTVSALVAVAVLVGLALGFGDNGLYLSCGLISAWSAFEYSRLTFGNLKAPLSLRVAFWILTVAVYLVTVWAEEYSLAVLATGSIMFLSMCLTIVRERTELNSALDWQSVGLMGLLYAGVFPALATKTIQLEGGSVWFYGLLLIVFCGDTMAYFVGKAIGRNRLLEAVSPKKSIEGALGGLAGSALGGLIIGQFLLKQVPLHILIPTAVVTGIFAQVGDLFESLIKRVASVKDSGSIMPGHGGALDRIDGILFAAPIYYVLFRFLLG